MRKKTEAMPKPISLKRRAAKGIITYIAEDFDALLEDFREYMVRSCDWSSNGRRQK